MAEAREELRQRLAGGLRPGQFAPLRWEFAAREPAAAFHALFSIAVEYTGDGADQVASRLLVDLEPACPVTCRDALLTLALGDWQLSNRLLPFYLISQFGKTEPHRVATELVAEVGLSGSQVTAVTGVAYWAGFPAVELLDPFVSWER
jgi:hypothetical protein